MLAQQKYAISKYEILLAAETLLEFQNIFLESEIVVFIDYENNVNLLTKHTLKCMQHQCQLIEEFGLKFVYLKGSANNLVDSLSQLDTNKEVP